MLNNDYPPYRWVTTRNIEIFIDLVAHKETLTKIGKDYDLTPARIRQISLRMAATFGLPMGVMAMRQYCHGEQWLRLAIAESGIPIDPPCVSTSAKTR